MNNETSEMEKKGNCTKKELSSMLEKSAAIGYIIGLVIYLLSLAAVLLFTVSFLGSF